MDNFSVKDIMKSNVVTVDSSASVKEAAKIMDDERIGCVVVTENNVAVGILTERDFVRKIAAKEMPLTTSVKQVMSSPLTMIDKDENIWELAELMKQKNIHKVPVMHDNKLTGIVTASDLTRICSIGSDSEMRRICDQIILRMQPKN